MSVNADTFPTPYYAVQKKGRAAWYSSFTTRVCRVDRDNSFDADSV